VIGFEAVSYTYPAAPAPALLEVSLDVGAGELVVVAGASGAGKSTLLRAVAGLVPHFYGGSFAGRLTVGGLDTREAGPGQLAACVGSLFQDPETQVVMGTVRAELAFPLENQGWSVPDIGRGVEEVALALAIDGLLERSTAELSGGELQRVALGATLAAHPRIVCLDEPTSQLDPVAGDELIGLLRRLNEDLELTVLLSEHRLERCLPLADRVVCLEEGGVAFDGPPDEFLGWAVRAAPALSTPGAKLLSDLGLKPAAGVKRARAALRSAGLIREVVAVGVAGQQKLRPPPMSGPGRPPSRSPALHVDRVWHELRDGPAILRGLTLEVPQGERVALMGRNGAGKSTLLRHAAGLMKPTRGRVKSSGRVALLLQNPNDYLIHERVSQEGVPQDTLERLRLGHLLDRHPRDLSGGERQRLALAIVLGDLADPPAVLCLDEPTRGLDRGAKEDLARLLSSLPCALVVATHDPEFAAAFSQRVVLMADGRVIAQGSPHQLLAGGTYFATETARILGGAALIPAEGAVLLRANRSEVPA
jgi:energy-coupling factor transporter ATP-binding protein EcfA2